MITDYFTVHIRSVGEWTRRVYDMFKQEKEEQAAQEEKPKSGVFNLAYSSDEDLSGDATHTVIQVEEQNTVDSGKGGRYINNLLEFNRKMSIYSKPPALLNVEMQRKPSVSPATMELRATSFLPMERKKSSSLSNLAVLKAELESSRRGDSGQSSLTGSTSSLDSIGENLCSTLVHNRQYYLHNRNATHGQDAHHHHLHPAVKKKVEVSSHRMV